MRVQLVADGLSRPCPTSETRNSRPRCAQQVQASYPPRVSRESRDVAISPAGESGE